MQRSRKALLQRRAELKKGFFGRKRLYRVSLSLVLLTWGVTFLLNSFISHGNGCRDGLGPAVGESSWHEARLDPNQGSNSEDPLLQLDATDDCNNDNSPTFVGEAAGTEVKVSEDNKLNLSNAGKEQVVEVISDVGIKLERETPLVKNDRLSRVAPPSLDEFKGKEITAKEKHLSSQTDTVIHRVEPGGKEYNYASATKGAKVLAFNKEAKGASNILDKDQDKYLRNPCSVEEKHVVIELSEETLVDTVEIANFEHYSSNLKDFELLSSSTYPTDNWVSLGHFTAGNVKHAQRFALPDPKWARYLKLNMLSHYGSEFYCTLSVVEVHGVDVVERMLEDLISVENRRSEPQEQNTEQMQRDADGDVLYGNFPTQIDSETLHEIPRRDVPKSTVADPVFENRPPQLGRMPGDSVLKILMQKVQSLDVNLSVLERYLEELNIRYGHIFKEFDDDIADKVVILEKIRLEIRNLKNREDVLAIDIRELLSWKSVVSSQLEQLIKDNSILRLEVDRIHDNQVDMENRGFAVIFMCFIFGCLAAAKLLMSILLDLCRICKSRQFCRTSSAWFILLLSSSTIAFISVA